MKEIKTKWWNDSTTANDGWRILITCYRPRALAYGKNSKPPIDRPTYKRMYLKEMTSKISQILINCLAQIVKANLQITLLCSSACTNENHCHRSLLKKLLKG
jgi:uncharacterized protein YeaO (DUF488 family)